MLKQRVITALVLVALVLGAIVLLPPAGFQGFIALCIGLGAWEWSRLAGLQAQWARGVFTLVFLAAMFAALHASPALQASLLRLSLLWWLVALLLVCFYPRGAEHWYKRAVLLPLGFVVLLPGWLALLYLRSLDQYVFFILLLLALVAAADSGAYFTGRAFGKRKLAPQVSPNKTWEGLAGGLVAVCVVLWAVLLIRGNALDLGTSAAITTGALLLGCASVVGDLFESLLKRQAGLKDSGSLLPGHGGVLDRIDSLTAALPVYSVLLLQVGSL